MNLFHDDLPAIVAVTVELIRTSTNKTGRARRLRLSRWEPNPPFGVGGFGAQIAGIID
jgi:hypothetical protein